MGEAGVSTDAAGLQRLLLRCSYQLQTLDYGWWLPLSARLPWGWGLRMSQWRGKLNRRWGRDWSELAQGLTYVAQQSLIGYQQMYPQATAEQLEQGVVERYQAVAREELEAQQAIAGRLLAHYPHLHSPALAALAQQRTHGRGLVIVMPHMGNFFLHCVALAQHLPKVHLVTSGVVAHPGLHPSLRRFYARKFQAYQGLMRGGHFMHTSKAAKDFFYQALRQGEAVVILPDAPATAEASGCWVPWFGEHRKVPDGALKMATATGSEMVVASGLWADTHGLEWQVSDILDPGHIAWDVQPTPLALQTYQTVFAFMESAIRRRPQAWWAAHLLPDYLLAPAPSVMRRVIQIRGTEE
ncbi:MAG: hypothetical protein RLZZ612_1138 [Pseudomonadota bacterium]